jgi:hypothetical protein
MFSVARIRSHIPSWPATASTRSTKRMVTPAALIEFDQRGELANTVCGMADVGTLPAAC